MKNRYLFILFILFSLSAAVYSQTQGEKLFKENNPVDAAQVLESEIQKKNITENSYNFLGLSYYQIGEYEKSVEAFSRGIKAQPENARILYFNQGNSYYALQDYNAAAECFTQALIADPDFSVALLNKANSLLMDDKLKNARENYSEFLKKNPDDVQREKISLIISALDEEIARREEEERERNRAMWEAVDASIEEKDENSEDDWELVDSSIDEAELANLKDKNEEVQDNPTEKSWEEIADSKIAEKVEAKNQDTEIQDSGENWEVISDNSLSKIPEEEIFEGDDWEELDEQWKKEQEDIDKDSKIEYEKRKKELEELAAKNQQAGNSARGMTEEEKEAFRKQILEDLQTSQNESRQKLLEDVTNSLQSNDASSMSSDADSLIEYDFESELD